MNTAFRKATLSIVLMITLLVAVPAWASTTYVFTGDIRSFLELIEADEVGIEDILDFNLITVAAGDDVEFYARCYPQVPERDILLSHGLAIDGISEAPSESLVTLSIGAILYLGEHSIFDLDDLFDTEPEDLSIDITITDLSITIIIQGDGFFLYFFLSPCSETQGPGGVFAAPYGGDYAVISTAILFLDDFMVGEFGSIAHRAGPDVMSVFSALGNVAAAQAHRLPDRGLAAVPAADFGQYTLTFVGDGETVAAVPQHIPHIGTVMITTSQAQPVYQSPAGQVIRDSAANEIWLPNDANNDGFDTYVVTGVRSVDGEIWLSIYLGSQIWGWVPLDAVTPLSYIPGTD
jgi:hypothetical protein